MPHHGHVTSRVMYVKQNNSVCSGAHIGHEQNSLTCWFTPAARVCGDSTPALENKAHAMDIDWGVARTTRYVSLRFEGLRPSFAMDRACHHF
jgi:hypothetical protein